MFIQTCLFVLVLVGCLTNKCYILKIKSTLFCISLTTVYVLLLLMMNGTELVCLSFVSVYMQQCTAKLGICLNLQSGREGGGVV